MNVLILEDDEIKYSQIEETLKQEIPESEIIPCEHFSKFVIESGKKKFDLIVTDLLVPLQKDAKHTTDVTNEIIDTIRDTESPNFSTPVIAITGFSEVATQNYEKFNRLDINIINYLADSDSWKEAFQLKIRNCTPPKTYRFIIFCALEKEAEAYSQLNFDIGAANCDYGINSRTIKIHDNEGIIIVPPRMGLVHAAITCSKAISLYDPEVICMSGICAGINSQANIYDVIISEMCHQHDSGKWTSDGFTPVPYAIQLQPKLQAQINQLIKSKNFYKSVKEGITLQKNEFPPDANELTFNIGISPTSSGSSVVASSEAHEEIKAQHLKEKSFDMESYALYEAARQASENLKFFSAKSVVDNGDEMKNDTFHRVASLLSAKTVFNLLSAILKNK
ncbi:nucleoside phosphorylase [Pseudoalteromonas carrageenovora]|uniref:5'-methylthioadenosine/S-adenosylhomocysteine nucleosidase family protein n=1 Tax=Pseudoalteromonas carrageenovora TaxID=227 RepID=UPI0026E17257|nr:nucleoside phosphorylase [Pseudoalteromonas carrageenovora]MDO6835789.1 nucleoside phosphorylase [Pseudoalteromonas carrageenovora]